MEARRHIPERRFSLKWKTLGLLGLALAIVHISLVLLDYRDRLQDSVERQQSELDTKLTILKQLLATSAERLHRIGLIVPSIVDALPDEVDIDERWSGLQLELDLQALLLQTSQGELIAKGLPYFGKHPPKRLLQAIDTARAEEKPRSFILCELSCVQYALTPSLDENGAPRLLVAATSLADIVIQFQQLTGADLALITSWPQRGRQSAALADGNHLVAISNAPLNEQRVRAQAETWNLEALRGGRNFNLGQPSYQASIRTLDDFSGLDGGYFLIFTNIAEELADIQRDFRSSIVIGITALLAGLLLGALILNRPMNQLRELAEALPLLAHKAYDQARDKIATDTVNRRLPTEIEVLQGVATDLTYRLEDLEGLVEARNRALAEKVSELQRSQELNEKIFANAPILMLMLSGDGQVVRVNEFACTLLGYSPAEFAALRFVDLVIDPRKRKEAGNALIDLLSGRRPLFEQSGEVRCVDDGTEAITWLHTRVSAESGIFVLSLGLPDKSETGGLRPPAPQEEPAGIRST